jgi:hypothetical protein
MTMNTPAPREGIHSDWLSPAHRTVESAPWRFVPRVEAASRGLTDKVAGLVEHVPVDPRPYTDAAARATPWALPPEPRDAHEASQQISDYFDAVAAMVRRLEAGHVSN